MPSIKVRVDSLGQGTTVLYCTVVGGAVLDDIGMVTYTVQTDDRAELEVSTAVTGRHWTCPVTIKGIFCPFLSFGTHRLLPYIVRHRTLGHIVA